LALSPTQLSQSAGRIAALMRSHGAAIFVEVLVNFLLPFLVYEWTYQSLGDFDALLCASLPPVAWALFEFLRRRRVDMLSLFAVSGIVLSMLAFLGGGSVRLLQLRENLVTAVIGLGFLVSVLAGRPLIYELAHAKLLRDPKDAEVAEDFAQDREARRSMSVMTLVCGVVLMVEAILASLLVFVLSIASYLLVSPILAYGTMGGLCLWAYWYGHRAADEAAPDSPPQ
jgi:hypothetical protein